MKAGEDKKRKQKGQDQRGGGSECRSWEKELDQGDVGLETLVWSLLVKFQLGSGRHLSKGGSPLSLFLYLSLLQFSH